MVDIDYINVIRFWFNMVDIDYIIFSPLFFLYIVVYDHIKNDGDGYFI